MDRTTVEQLKSYLEALSCGTLDDDTIYHALHEFGREDFLDARPVVESYLCGSNPHFRYVALDVVGNHWRLAEHWQTAAQMLISDLDEDCRRMGASVLGTLMRDTQDVQTLGILAHTVLNADEDVFVRQTAYRSMRELWQYSPQETGMMMRSSYDFQRDADWLWVATYSEVPPAHHADAGCDTADT